MKIVTVSAALVVSFSACDKIPAVTDQAPLIACEPASISAREWPLLAVPSCHVQLRLPNGFVRKQWQVETGTASGASFRKGLSEQIHIQVFPTRTGVLEHGALRRQSSYTEYSECRVTIGGREAILQSFRGGAEIVSAGHSYPMFQIAAVWLLTEHEYIAVVGQSVSRKGQEEILAAVHSLEFR